MKTFSNALIHIAGIVALCSAPLFAQNSMNLTAHVPFAFHAGTKSLPAGDYRFYCEAGSPNVFIQAANGSGIAMIPTNNDRKLDVPRESKLIFRVYGNQNYLGALWGAGIPTGRVLLKTASEKESERAGIPMHLAVLQASAK